MTSQRFRPCAWWSECFWQPCPLAAGGALLVVTLAASTLASYAYMYPPLAETTARIVRLGDSGESNLEALEAMKIFVSDTQFLAGFTVTLVAYLWALLAVRQTSLELTNIAQRVVFIVTNLVLMTSYLAFAAGHNLIIDRLVQVEHHAVGFLQSSSITFCKAVQHSFFLLGGFSAAITLQSCRSPKETP